MAKRKKNVSDTEVREAFRRNYRRSEDWSKAWNDTLEELAGPYSPATSQKRHEVSDALRRISDEVLYEEGDPLQVLIEETARALESDQALKILDDEHEKASEGLSEREREEMEYPVMYLEFGKEGFEGWVIEHPQYYQGHAGPTVVVFPGMDIEDVKHEVGNTLADVYEANPSRASNPAPASTKQLKSKLLR